MVEIKIEMLICFNRIFKSFAELPILLACLLGQLEDVSLKTYTVTVEECSWRLGTDLTMERRAAVTSSGKQNSCSELVMCLIGLDSPVDAPLIGAGQW